MRCSVCGKQKANLTQRPSRLFSKTNFYYCSEDIDKEPRYLIVLVGRDSRQKVKHYLENRLYVGPLITESDLS